MKIFKVVIVQVFRGGVIVGGQELEIPGHSDIKSLPLDPVGLFAKGEESDPIQLRVNGVVVWEGPLKDLPKRFDYELKAGEHLEPPPAYLGPPPTPAPSSPVAVPRTALDDQLWSAVNSGDEEEAAALVRQGANLNARSDRGYTLLSESAMNGHYRTAEFLLRQGADANVADPEGVTPLMMAAYMGCTPMVAMLLKHGASTDGQSGNGWNLRSWIQASDYRTEDIERLLQDPKLVEDYETPADFLNEWK